MNLDKIHKNKSKEIGSLQETLKSYIYLYKTTQDVTEQRYYRFSMNIIINKINVLLGADDNLNTTFKRSLTRHYCNTFEKGLDSIALQSFDD